MKILHTIASMASQSGGTTACTRELVQTLNDLGCATDILTVEDKAGNPAEEESSFIHAVPNDLRTPLGISMNLRRRLGAWRDYDLYHTNGLWLDVNHATCAQARKTRKPCVASPHGMLYPQALAIKPWRKKLMLALGHRRDLAQADCLHATCREEARHLRELGFANPVAVIPNPVAVPSWIDQIRRREGERFRAGFLGRFHPIKNLESLIRAWGSLNLRGRGAPSHRGRPGGLRSAVETAGGGSGRPRHPLYGLRRGEGEIRTARLAQRPLRSQPSGKLRHEHCGRAAGGNARHRQ